MSIKTFSPLLGQNIIVMKKKMLTNRVTRWARNFSGFNMKKISDFNIKKLVALEKKLGIYFFVLELNVVPKFFATSYASSGDFAATLFGVATPNYRIH